MKSNILKYTLSFSAVVVVGLSIAYFVIEQSKPKKAAAPVVVVPVEESERTNFLDAAFKDPALIEKQPIASKPVAPVEPDASLEEAEKVEEEVATYIPPAELSSGQIALRHQLEGFASLRTDSIRNPKSPENRKMMQALAQKRKARHEAQ